MKSDFLAFLAEGGLLQISPINALMAGCFDGSVPVGDVLAPGVCGIGTVDGLDGELFIADGLACHVRADGMAYPLADGEKIPFGMLASLAKAETAEFPAPLSLAELTAEVDARAGEKNAVLAFSLTGSFARAHTRSVPRQDKPYKPLHVVTRAQPEFRLEAVEGTLVGFRFPAYFLGVNAPGWHLHLRTADGRGGHLLDCRLLRGMARWRILRDFRMLLPENSAAFTAADLSRDFSAEVREVERLGRQ